MKVGVPGEFHEDRWQRTAEDSERCMIPRTREAGGTHRIQVIAWQSVLLSGIRHDKLVHRYPRGIILWRSQTGHLPLLIHEIGLFHGHRGLDRVLVHEIGFFHGHRGLDRVLIHEIGLFHGR